MMAEEIPFHKHLEMWAMAIYLKHAGMSIPEEFQKIMILNSLPESWQSGAVEYRS